MLPEIKTIEDYNKIRTEIHQARMLILNHQLKQMFLHGLTWAICHNCNGEFEQTLKAFKDKEEILKQVWLEKFSYYSIIKKHEVKEKCIRKA